MSEERQICPYTGLRPFTEDESIYFKGREEHIGQATEQLQRNKFLMLTGASGDGKSSLVYAGIVPNARAGFLKSRYTQWCLADFRPERTPFQNLCKAIGRQLGISNYSTVESELQHGFSALTDLYKNSARYLDTESAEWQQADEKKRAGMKRQAANLIILVDQFEEFFSNPENYHNGVPSKEAGLVLNLLLESARISLEENLPVYIVFTMRSDYIGQCAAFRTLPEYIGFSQFFVPRLNRSQLQQVIEEPAVLSGNRISRRLTERLIQDLTDGVDQLPILQHALNQVWHAANGAAVTATAEMDLIHYAMVGGMKVDELPDDQVAPFKIWYDGLSTEIKSFYRNPDLQNVLDTHANKLCASAGDYFRKQTGKATPDDQIKYAIRKTFSCLTKIDQSRAVRNRMTLKEIWGVAGLKDLTLDELGEILKIFREPGNTFIRPFITDEPEAVKLGDDDVLDITHESLIRNWEFLGAWATEEFNNHNVYLDFEQQLRRWIDSGKSTDFLLSIGPLTYFEAWYEKLAPNAHWIARYLPEDIDAEEKIRKARILLDDSRAFLRRSARQHIATRTVVKYGPKRIFAVLAVFLFLTLSSFGIREYLSHQNARVLEKIKDESIALAGNRIVSLEDKNYLLSENLKLGLTTIPEVVNGISDPLERINAIAGVGTALVNQGWNGPAAEIYQSFAAADSLLELQPVSLTTPRYSEMIRESVELMVSLELAYYFNPNPEIRKLVHRNAHRLGQWVLLVARKKPESFKNITAFDLALERAISLGELSEQERIELLSLLSPFEMKETDKWVSTKFARDIFSERGRFNYAFPFNGLYQELAYVYASLGQTSSVLRCLDSLIANNVRYQDRNYDNMPDNSRHLAAVFYKYDRIASLDEFVKSYSTMREISEHDFYKSVVNQSLAASQLAALLNNMAWQNVDANPILYLADSQQQAFFYARYRAALRKIKDADNRNFWLALSYKDQGLMNHLAKTHRQTDADPRSWENYFDSAFYYYRKVNQRMLDTEVSMLRGSEQKPWRFLFEYPDFAMREFPGEPRGGYIFFTSPGFIIYVLKNKLFDEVYKEPRDLDFINVWFDEQRVAEFFAGVTFRSIVDLTLVRQLEKAIERRKSSLDFSDLHLEMAAQLAAVGKLDSANAFYKRVTSSRIGEMTSAGGFAGFGAHNAMYKVGFGVSSLAESNDFAEANRIVHAFRKPVNRSALYGFAARLLLKRNAPSEVVTRVMDSARAEMLRVENSGADQQARFQLPFALALRNQPGDLDDIRQISRNVLFKIEIQAATARSLAFHNQLYDAYDNMPEGISAPEKASFLSALLYGYSEGRESPSAWSAYATHYPYWRTIKLFYSNEN
jgi:hypothetical protein